MTLFMGSTSKSSCSVAQLRLQGSVRSRTISFMSSWSCPHDLDGVCQHVRGARCDPGMRGCILHGRFRFAKDEGGGMRKPVKALPAVPAKPKRPSN